MENEKAKDTIGGATITQAQYDAYNRPALELEECFRKQEALYSEFWEKFTWKYGRNVLFFEGGGLEGWERDKDLILAESSELPVLLRSFEPKIAETSAAFAETLARIREGLKILETALPPKAPATYPAAEAKTA